MAQQKRLITFNIDNELYANFKDLLCVLEDCTVTEWLVTQINGYVDEHKDAIIEIEEVRRKHGKLN